jgi:hypothetical protein
MRFVSQNIEMYVTNGSVHELNTRNKLKLYIPNVNLSLRQKGVHYASIKIFNKLPGFVYLQRKFPRISDAKIKDGIFIGLQIRE